MEGTCHTPSRLWGGLGHTTRASSFPVHPGRGSLGYICSHNSGFGPREPSRANLLVLPHSGP